MHLAVSRLVRGNLLFNVSCPSVAQDTSAVLITKSVNEIR